MCTGNLIHHWCPCTADVHRGLATAQRHLFGIPASDRDEPVSHSIVYTTDLGVVLPCRKHPGGPHIVVVPPPPPPPPPPTDPLRSDQDSEGGTGPASWRCPDPLEYEYMHFRSRRLCADCVARGCRVEWRPRGMYGHRPPRGREDGWSWLWGGGWDVGGATCGDGERGRGGLREGLGTWANWGRRRGASACSAHSESSFGSECSSSSPSSSSSGPSTTASVRTVIGPLTGGIGEDDEFAALFKIDEGGGAEDEYTKEKKGKAAESENPTAVFAEVGRLDAQALALALLESMD
ncbi:hypothetical protein VTK26DRAFT_5968 [Humicola hyalothermophila]